MPSSHRYALTPCFSLSALLVFSLFTLLILSPASALRYEKGRVTFEFSKSYDPSDQFFNFRLSVKSRNQREPLFTTRRIPGVFSPDEKLPLKFTPRYKIFNLKNRQRLILLFVPRVNDMITGISVVPLFESKSGEYTIPMTSDALKEKKMLDDLDYQSGILLCRSGFLPSQVSVKGDEIHIFEPRNGKTAIYQFTSKKVIFKRIK